MSHWRLFYHVVWATRKREPLIDDGRAAIVERSIRAACNERGAIIHAVGVMPDHVHVAVSIPPRFAVAEVVQQFKGSSSHVLNHEAATVAGATFAWQPQYGVTSFGERSLERVAAYVRNQAAHHAADNLWLSLELTERPYSPDNETNNGLIRSPGGAL